MFLSQFVPPLSRDLADLKARTITAAKNIDANILTRVWQELEYCIGVYSVTRGAQTEHLYTIAVIPSTHPLTSMTRTRSRAHLISHIPTVHSPY